MEMREFLISSQYTFLINSIIITILLVNSVIDVSLFTFYMRGIFEN